MAGEIIGDILRLTVLATLGAAGVLAILIWKKNLATRVTLLRLVIQAVAFTAIFYLFTYIVPLFYVLIILFSMTLILGRFFCGWLCPFALIMDIEILVRKALKIRHRIIPDKLNIALHKARYAILLFILLTPVLLWLLDPQGIMVSPIMVEPLAGHYRPYSILLDPMVTFIVSWTGDSVFTIVDVNFSYPYAQNIVTYMGIQIGQIFLIAFVAITLIGSFFIRRAWCRFCPTGGSLAIVNRFRGFRWSPLLHINKDEEKCTKCGVCKRVCPVQVNEVYEQRGGKIKTSQCMLCTRCLEMCPYEGTLKLQLGRKTVFKSRNWLEPSNVE